ncbi:MAG TPA: Type 1 glutamine amidotransferase-like domain-containing protein, partial [Anaerolineales bacterium]|nr:Type 1 glutamine amidotransferase-like domain-containing protein [Anaerolineales bacterium]
MNGLIALVGSGEYLAVMDNVDRHLLDSLNLNGRKPRVVCLPTAAGREGHASINRWSSMGIEHFQKLGAEVSALRIIDRASADDVQWESLLEEADLVYFSGGDPGYLHQTLNGSRAWRAARRAWERGAVYAGCSAGAMILAKRMPSFRLAGTQAGFGLLPAMFIV